MILHGDALHLPLADASVDAIVTDPPYGLEFMGKEWDRFSGKVSDRDFKGFVLSQQRTRNVKCPECDRWAYDHPGRACECGGVRRAQGNAFQRWCEAWAAEALRVLKPGGHLLAFGGTRTWHRLVCAIEDAGFEIRDNIAWLYGSGFPKSLDVSKAIDKAAGAERSIIGRDEMLGHYDGSARESGRRLGRATYAQDAYSTKMERTRNITAPATDDAARWSGWGTALKPGYEPIVVARKPLAGTVAANVLAHGTGALNIDGCRVAHVSEADRRESEAKNRHADFGSGPRDNKVYGVDLRLRGAGGNYDGGAGRWPSNVVLDDEAAAELDQQSGNRPGNHSQNSFSAKPKFRAGVDLAGELAAQVGYREGYDDSGGASRFFPVFRYEAKAPTEERPVVNGVAHPTVKPLDLMRWLVRLVTPPGGVVLDPFVGSGTTAEACVLEGFRCVAVEQDATYLPLTVARLSKPLQPTLDGVA